MSDWQFHTLGTDSFSEESRQIFDENNGETWQYEGAFKAEQLRDPMIASYDCLGKDNHAINSTPVHHINPHADHHTQTFQDFDTSMDDNQHLKSPEGSSKMRDSPPPLQLKLEKANSVKSLYYNFKDNAYKVKRVFLLNLIYWDSAS